MSRENCFEMEDIGEFIDMGPCQLVRDSGDRSFYVGQYPHNIAYIIPSVKCLQSYEAPVMSIYVEDGNIIAYFIETIKAQLQAFTQDIEMDPRGRPSPAIRLREVEKHRLTVYYRENGYIQTNYEFIYAEEEKMFMLVTNFLMCPNYVQDPHVAQFEEALLATFNSAIAFPETPLLGEFTTDMPKIATYFEYCTGLRASTIIRPQIGQCIDLCRENLEPLSLIHI